MASKDNYLLTDGVIYKVFHYSLLILMFYIKIIRVILIFMKIITKVVYTSTITGYLSSRLKRFDYSTCINDFPYNLHKII